MRSLFMLFCIGLVALSASAKLVPGKDPLDGVLSAQLVVIVRPGHTQTANPFIIEEVFLGNAKPGETVDLGEFQLATEQQYGPDLIDAITPGTRILLFLQRKQGSPTVWEPTYYKHSYFWVKKVEDSPLLKRAAERAVSVRNQWEDCLRIADPKQKVAALWPFLDLHEYGVDFVHRTTSELKRISPQAGEYFAAHLDEMSSDQRMLLLADAGDYGSSALHDKLRNHIDQQRRAYADFVERLGRIPTERDWRTFPKAIQGLNGEIYYGVAGLAKFRQTSDLPFFREIALWATKYEIEQTAEATLTAFRSLPQKANLPVIDLVHQKFSPQIDVDVERALSKHKFPETVPLLAPFVTTDYGGSDAQAALWEIVGRDLGRDPKAWMDWYQATQKPTPKQSPIRQ
ncbi:MAG: hypothetical protein JWO13_1160 [Acidobacteriales bacterium]|nr:hypothetical protein [Terriglobales bacterium]